MQSDLCERRLGWICLVAIILFSGPKAQSIFAAADDENADDHPKPHMQMPQRHEFGEPRPSINWMSGMPGSDQDGGKYWLGVECREAQPELKSQLGLKDDEGLVAVHLMDDGPAAKAGLKRHDVIVAAGDEKLKHLSDLIKAVNASDGKEISLKILRGGKEQTILATPVERPQENAQIIARPGPGFMWPSGGPRMDLPDNVSVTIGRKGKEPVKITVTRGDEKWEISDKELDKLPEELRPAVQRMLGGGPMPFPMPGGFNMPGMRIEGMPMGGSPGFNPPPRDGNPHPRDGQNFPPPPDRNPPPRDGNESPSTPGQPGFSGGPGMPMMQPGQIPPELIERLEQLDRRLEMLQHEMRRLQEGGPRSPPRVRPHGLGFGPDGPPSNDEQRPGPPPRDNQRDGPPGMHGGPPPGDGDHQGPPGSSFREPPPNDQ
jgi:hypothetical protein